MFGSAIPAAELLEVVGASSVVSFRGAGSENGISAKTESGQLLEEPPRSAMMRTPTPTLDLSTTPEDLQEPARAGNFPFPDAGGPSLYLPYDILVIVVGLLERRHIVQIIKTCNYYRNLLEPLLYRHLEVSDRFGRGPQIHLKCFLLHRTLAARPDLLPCILSYRGPVISEPGRISYMFEELSPDDGDLPVEWSDIPSEEESQEISRRLFCRMVNLQILRATQLNSSEMAEVLEAAGINGSGIKLKKLVVNGPMQELAKVLRAQPELNELKVGGRVRGVGPFRFTEDLVPGLVAVTAPLWDAAEIIPGRPVKVLNISAIHGTISVNVNNNPTKSETEERFMMLARSTSGIVDLTFTSTARRPMYDCIELPWISRHLPQVVRLSFSGPIPISDKMLLETLPGLVNLSYLKLPSLLKEHTWPGDERQDEHFHDETSFLLLLRWLKGCCSHLVQVDWRQSDYEDVMYSYIIRDGEVKIVHYLM